MPKRISFSPMPRGSGPAGTFAVGAVAAFAAVAAAAGDGPMTLERLGPEIEPDKGWCAGAVLVDIQRGTSDGVDLGGVKAAWVGNWPGNFFGGNGTQHSVLAVGNYGDNGQTAGQRPVSARQRFTVFSTCHNNGPFWSGYPSQSCKRPRLEPCGLWLAPTTGEPVRAPMYRARYLD